MTLTEFLLARIAEDEASARVATQGRWKLWGMSVMADTLGDSNVEHCAPVAHTQWADANGKPRTWNASHICRFDPARVLAECEVKRRIVEDWTNQVAGWLARYEMSELELHQHFMHREWEYESRESQRKGDSPGPPEGEGWEANNIVDWGEHWRNWDRGEFVDTEYWRRRRSEPAPLPTYSPPRHLVLMAAVYADHPDYCPDWSV